MENNTKTQQEIEKEILELNEQFGAFLHTKGIRAKFQLAFGDIAEFMRNRREADTAAFETVKAQSTENNKEFTEFLHTKGIRAKYRLVVENIKKGAGEASANTAKQIAKVQAQMRTNIERAGSCGRSAVNLQDCSAEFLAEEFHAFLKEKGLDSQYDVVITEEKS